MARVWLGGIYVKNGGGYEIILRSLRHYRKRLMTLGRSPELKESAAMFASVLGAQAKKTIPQIGAAEGRLCRFLAGDLGSADMQKDVPFLDKALACYESDIGKAQNTGHEYFVGLVGDMQGAQADLKTVQEARRNIGAFEG